MADPGHEALGDGRVALHRQPSELDREQIDQQVADDEHRHREADHRQHHDGAVDPRRGLPGGEHAERDGDDNCQQERRGGQRYGRLDALRDQLVDGLMREDGDAEIASENPADPAHELHGQRIVEAELLADGVDLHLSGVVADDDRGRVARRQMQQQENEDRDGRHDQHGREQSADDEGQHARSLPFGYYRTKVLSYSASPPANQLIYTPIGRAERIGTQNNGARLLWCGTNTGAFEKSLACRLEELLDKLLHVRRDRVPSKWRSFFGFGKKGISDGD